MRVSANRQAEAKFGRQEAAIAGLLAELGSPDLRPLGLEIGNRRSLSTGR
jgi:hypothetical protein